MKYIVSVTSKVTTQYSVEADTPSEAIASLRGGGKNRARKTNSHASDYIEAYEASANTATGIAQMMASKFSEQAVPVEDD